jgi:hypothetical protein
MLVVACLLLLPALPAAAAHPHDALGTDAFVTAASSAIDSEHCPSGHGHAERPGSPSHDCAPAHIGCCMLPTVHVATFAASTATAWPATGIDLVGLKVAPPLPPPIASSSS